MNFLQLQEEFEPSKKADLNAKYSWELNKMVPYSASKSELLKDTVIHEGVPIRLIEPNRSTLQAYQELVLSSESFPSQTIANNRNYKLTSRGRDALNLFKVRYEELFSVPTGLSKIIPPDVLDESAFLPVIERFKQKNRKKRKRSKTSSQYENVMKMLCS